MRLAYGAAGNNYDALKTSGNSVDIVKLKKMIQVGWIRYMVALHLKGLNHIRSGAL